jgi:outer membrane protein assembly factor BamB
LGLRKPDQARGDITGTGQVVWTRRQRTPYVPSPLLYDDSLYFLRHYQGILSRVHAETGEERHAPLRLPGIGDVYASPVGAAGRIYVTDRGGLTVVISHDSNPKVLAQNQLSDSFSASAAVVDGELYLRGQHSLYCIARD